MTLISDILLIAGALGVAFYCIVLSRRLARFTDLEKGVGGAIAVLSAQVDDMTRTLKAAQAQATASGHTLNELTARAEDVARRLELHVASMHDLEGTGRPTTPPPAMDDASNGSLAFRRTEPEAAPSPPPPSRGDDPVPEIPRKGSAPVRSFFSSHRHPGMETAE